MGKGEKRNRWIGMGTCALAGWLMLASNAPAQGFSMYVGSGVPVYSVPQVTYYSAPQVAYYPPVTYAQPVTTYYAAPVTYPAPVAYSAPVTPYYQPGVPTAGFQNYRVRARYRPLRGDYVSRARYRGW